MEKDELNTSKLHKKIYTVPFVLPDVNENISICTNSFSTKSLNTSQTKIKGFGKKNKRIKNKAISNINELSKQHLIKKAISLHLEGNITEAAKCYKFLIKQGFKDPTVYSNYGLILKDKGHINEAIKLFKKSIYFFPNEPEPYSNLGNILKDLGEFKEAEICTKKAITLKPDYAEAYSNLSYILFNLNNIYDAKNSAQKAIDLNPDLANAHLNLGIILMSLNKLDEAEKSIRKSIKLNPLSPNSFNNLGTIQKCKGELIQSELSYKRALEISPNFVESLFNLGVIYKYLAKYTQLIDLDKYIINCINIDIGMRTQILLRLSLTYYLTGDFDKAKYYILETKSLIYKDSLDQINLIKNRQHTFSFFNLLFNILSNVQDDRNIPNLKTIIHLGESHCLSFAYENIFISSQYKTIKPIFIEGAKAWHFATSEYNMWKDMLKIRLNEQQLKEEVFISFGEIDCRLNEGILKYSQKYNMDVLIVCKKTISDYLIYMESILSSYFSKRYYFGVPAPFIVKSPIGDLDKKRVNLIKLYNSLLKKEVLLRGAYFLDVYDLTSNTNGLNNNLYMCDGIHLSPKCLPILFNKFLYKPSPN